MLEMFIRHDIDNGYGVTLLDPSENGSTAHSILKYCLSKKHRNVLWIDLRDRSKHIPIINPLHWFGEESAPGVVASVMDAVRLLWGQTDWQTTARIQTYLKAVLYALYFGKCSLADAQAFTETPVQKSEVDQSSLFELARRRKIILSRLPKGFHYRNILEGVFAKPDLFKTEFRPTIRRLDPFFEPPACYVFGSTKQPINFEEIIRKKTTVLVCLDTKRAGGEDLQRLLGTAIVNGLVDAMSFLTGDTSWKGRHYLYIDEAGLFATRALTRIMSYQGKSGLWATVAHHYSDQFDDPKILKGITNNTHIKVLFYTGDSAESAAMLKNMYYGDLRKQAEDAAALLKKQQAMIRIGKDAAQIFTVGDVPEVQSVTDNDIKAFKEEIYQTNPCYRNPAQVEGETTKRFAFAKTTEPIRRDNLVTETPKSPSMVNGGKGDDVQSSSPSGADRRQGKFRGSTNDTGSKKTGRKDGGVQVRGSVRPDFADVETARKRRGSGKKQGDKLEGE